LSNHNSRFAIEERRRQIAILLAKCKTQTEIAQELGYDQSTISNDIQALKEMSERFIFDLAKSDLGYLYQQKLISLDEAKRKAWDIYNNDSTTTKERLLALKLIIMSDEASFRLLSEGPAILSIKSMGDKISEIEQIETLKQR
jgi:hypothetical protein